MKVERAAGGGVVGVGDPPRPVRRRHHLVVADHRLTDALEQRARGQRRTRIMQADHTATIPRAGGGSRSSRVDTFTERVRMRTEI